MDETADSLKNKVANNVGTPILSVRESYKTT